SEIKDLYWTKPDGQEMTDADWASGNVSCLGMGLPGNQIEEVDERGARVVGDTFALILNAHHDAVDFRLGARHRDVRWHCEIDTAQPEAEARVYEHSAMISVSARSLIVLRAESVTPIASK